MYNLYLFTKGKKKKLMTTELVAMVYFWYS